MKTTQLLEVTLIGHKKDRASTIRTLHELGVLHIGKATSKEKAFVEDEVSKDLDSVSTLLLKLRYIAEEAGTLNTQKITSLPDFTELLKESNEFVDKYLQQVQNYQDEKKQLFSKKQRLEAQIKVLESFPFVVEEAKKGYVKRLYASHQSLTFPDIKKKIPFTLRKINEDKLHYYVFTTTEKRMDELQLLLRETPLKKIDIAFIKENSEITYEKLQQELLTVNKQLKQLKKTIRNKLGLEQVKLPYLLTALENYRDECLISQQFLASKNFFVIKGYAEEKSLPLIREELTDSTLTVKPAGIDAPTKLNDKGLNKHFQTITELFGLPKYGSVDPTPLISLFYPFFFGFMLSDIGYGLLLLVAIISLRSVYGKSMQTPFVIFGLSAVSSIIFGLLFGSFFGNLVVIEPLIADTFSASFGVLIVSLIIGLVHLNIGAILNIIQLKNQKVGLRKILVKGGAFFLLEIAALFAVLGLYPLAIVFAVLLLFVLFKEKGAFGLMDITGFVGTWFSYARLLALSLATAGVALAINIIAEKMLHLGKLGIILWLIVLLVGHLFNFALNLLGCTIHAARLHYVEFFGFFFEEGGKKFTPFTIKKDMEA